jgi:hypothetical protein
MRSEPFSKHVWVVGLRFQKVLNESLLAVVQEPVQTAPLEATLKDQAAGQDGTAGPQGASPEAVPPTAERETTTAVVDTEGGVADGVPVTDTEMAAVETTTRGPDDGLRGPAAQDAPTEGGGLPTISTPNITSPNAQGGAADGRSNLCVPSWHSRWW